MKWKSGISILCAALLLAVCPLEAVFAGTADSSAKSGSLTAGISWSKKDGELQLNGSGEMPSYSYGEAPWVGKNSLATPEDVIVTAEGEMGYHEKKNGRSMYEKDDNNGEANYTKYSYELSQIKGSGISNPAQWCDIFVDWCMNKTFGTERAKSLLCGAFNGYTPTSSNYYKKKGQWHTTPVVGDQVFFQGSTRINHTGIVVKVTDDRVYTIEGNATDRVRKRSYLLTDSYIAGYGRPAYDAVSSVQDIQSVNIADGIRNVGDWSFAFSTGLRKAQLPETIRSIGDYAFYNCRSLSDVAIPSGVNAIGKAAFQNCSIYSLNLPEKMDSLGESAFYGCSNLPDVILPSGITTIEDYTFMGCTGMKHIWIPASVNHIKLSAFGACSNLTDIRFEGTPEQWNAIFMDGEDNRDKLKYDLSKVWVHYNSRVVDHFHDVFTDDWFADYVDAVFHKNLMIGTDDDHFTPAGTTDRAMLVTILYRMAGSPDVQEELKAMQEEADRKAAEAAENAKNQEESDNTGVNEEPSDTNAADSGVNEGPSDTNAADSGVNEEPSDANATDSGVNEGPSDPETKTETGVDAGSQDDANADGSATEDKTIQETVNTMALALFDAESEDKTEDSAGDKETAAEPEQEAAEERPMLPQFQDVPDGEYYTDAVRWAYLHHLVDGYNELTFGPKDPITREQSAVILRNYAKMTGMETTAENALSKFADYGAINDWALEALAWANHVNLIQGISDTEIDPGSHATRAQIATLVNRFDEMLPKS